MTTEEFWYTGLASPAPVREPVLEAYVSGRWCKVTEWIFRSWTGPRRIDGKDYLGDVYYLGSEQIARVR